MRSHSENEIAHSEIILFSELRELLREYPGTLPEFREWPVHSESVFPKIGVVPRLLNNWPRKDPPKEWGFSSFKVFFFLLSAFFCLDCSSLPLLLHVLKPKNLPTRMRSSAITYTKTLVVELIFRTITYCFADLSLIRINFRKYVISQCLKHDPTELYTYIYIYLSLSLSLSLSGGMNFRRSAQ